MRFTCDSCSAQYMISDEKVGPNGVKVRCKKCGHVILVKRPPQEPEPAAVPAAPSAPEEAAAPPPRGDGLDEELGQAFDKVMSGGLAEEPRAPAVPEPSEPPVAPAPAPAAEGRSPLATEWYVAIEEQQVGPMPPDEVKARWEAGAVGPDGLVWCAGMADWAPISSVAELATFLAPFPRAERTARATAPLPEAPRPAATAASASTTGAAAVAAAPGAEPADWKPGAASALAALASEEIASMKAPSAEAAGGGASKGKLLESMNLPDAGGVDPTGAIPLPIKGLESTGEKKISSVARTTAEIRIKRSANRTILAVAAGLVVVFAAGAAGLYWYFDRKLDLRAAVAVTQPAPPRPSPAEAVPPPAPAAAPAASPQAAAPAATGGVPGTPTAAPAPPEAQAAAPSPGAPAAAPPQAPAPPAPVAAPPVDAAAPASAGQEAGAPPAPKAASSRAPAKKKGKAEPKPARKPSSTRALASAASAAAAPEAPAAARKKTGDPLLDASDVDAAFERELQGGSAPAKRSVYVPPAPGTDLPERLTESQIQEGVASRIDSLKQCVAQQQGQSPDVHGTLKLQWTIQGDGTVGGVKVQSPELAGQPIAGCIANVVKTIRFPRSRTSGQSVSFPFGF